MKRTLHRTCLAATLLGSLTTLPGRAETFTLEEASIAEMQAAMAAGAISSVELLSLYLNRLAVYDQNGVRINSTPVIDPTAFAQAQAADELRASNTILGPLHGIPGTVKDSYNVNGLPTTDGVEAFKTLLIASSDAKPVSLLKAKGAVIFGKANMELFAADIRGISDSYGQTLNPYNVAAGVGGSSSGSGAGVAANFTAFSMGGDTGGSIRIPASFNGVVGLKPTIGNAPAGGTFPLIPARDVVGPLTKFVADTASVMDAIVAEDPTDPWAALTPALADRRPATYATTLRTNALQGKRFGIPKHYVGTALPDSGLEYPVDPEVSALFARARQIIEAQGGIVVEVDTTPAVSAWSGSSAGATIWETEYDPIYPADDQFGEVTAFYYNDFLRGFGTTFPEVADLIPNNGYLFDEDREFYVESIESGTAISLPLATGFQARANLLRNLVAKYHTQWMTDQGLDALIGPTVSGPHEAGQFYGDAYPAGWGILGWYETCEFGLPGVSVTMGTMADGSHAGIQFVGKTYFSEAEILGYAHAFEQAAKARTSPALTPALPGETIEYSTALPPPSRPELNAPALRVAGGAKVTGKGKKTALVVTGRARDASGLSSLKVYVNGKKIAAKRAAKWKASVKLSALRKFVRGDAKTVSVQVVAKDIYGNTSVTTKNVKLPKGA